MGAKKAKAKKRWLPAAVIAFFIGLFLALAAALIFWLAFQQKFQNRIFPGIKIAGQDVSGLNFLEAQKKLNQKINQLATNGFVFIYEKKEAIVPLTITSPNADLTYDIISFSPEKTISQALRFGRGRDQFKNLSDIYLAWQNKINFALAYSWDKQKIKEILEENFSQFELKPQNAKLIWSGNSFIIQKEKPGLVLDYKRAFNSLKAHIQILDNSPVEIFTLPAQPQITRQQCNLNYLELKAKQIIDKLPIILTADNNRWQITKQQLINWLILKKIYPACPANQPIEFCRQKAQITLGLNKEKLTAFLKQAIGAEIDRQPVDAKFKIENGRVVEFQTSQDGRRLAVGQTAAKIEEAILSTASATTEMATTSRPIEIKIVTEKVPSKITTSNINNLGIKEIIGTGHSNFAGSPKNRRHNIAQGAKTLHGLLIKPGEEFSLVKALGEINAETGYLPELVIKGNKTIPEFGGGLCQIGTTMFRAALASGLPILERRNHSYRVSYYEPAGTDATIYNPKPDLRFKNDTGHYILIQTRIDGNDLYFDFWGTKDGRQVKISKPTIYNIVRPGPAKLIETTDLPAGEKKCTEHAHNGADAYFDYTVTYPDGTVQHKRFTSHYRPWQEVCLIGVKKTASTSAETVE